MPQTTEIVYYRKVTELYKALGLKLQQKMQFSINNLQELHHRLPYVSPIFRQDYYSFVFIKDAKGICTTDEQTYEFAPHTFYFTNPGHLKSFEVHEAKEAYLVTISEEFLKLNVHQNVFEEFPFLLTDIVPPQVVDKKSWTSIELLYLQILKEYNNHSKLKNRIIGNLFVVLLLKIKEILMVDPIEGNNQNSIVKKFRRDLETHYRHQLSHRSKKLFQSQDYAHLQHLNPNYFSQVIKNKTGKTPSQWIAAKSVTLAKSMLQHSSKSIKEISYSLGFSETAHFSNYFKKNAGIPPTSYRKLRSLDQNDKIHK